ncbi:MAG: DUF1883 domain-containing protein [Spirochaetales bacterium]|nr:DUF1883 domain-containing protein [Spirochaetales bacterium]
MNYLHYKFKADPNNEVKVTLNQKANVFLLDTASYYKYRLGKAYEPTAAYNDVTSIHIKVPHKSNWHLLIEHSDAFKGIIRALVDVI